MTDTNNTNTPNTQAPKSAPVAPGAKPAVHTGGRSFGDRRGGPRATGPRGQRGGRGGKGQGGERIKPEFDSKIIDMRRVTRVTSGGKRMNFSVVVVAGDRKGRVGVGLGKGADTSISVEKATREAKKNILKIPLTPMMTIPHAVEAKYSSAIVKLFPARGRGLVAGSAARVVLELAGIKDVSAKLLSGSKNKLNISRATVLALSRLSKIHRNVLLGKPMKAVK
jgi:small subunit ribosomal protein S5